MNEVWHILLGVVVTVVFCWSAGRLALSRLQVRLYRFEEHLIAGVCGAAIVSLFVFLTCLAGVARKGVFQWSALGVLVLALWQERKRPRSKALPAAPRGWIALFAAAGATFFFVYFFHALAPEVSPDGSGYHLGNVDRIWRNRGFVWDHHDMYAYLSQGLEMLFLVAYSFGRNSAAAMVHLAFQTILPLLMISFGLRIGFPRAAIFAALVTYVSPVVGLDGSIAYNDVALAAVLFTIVYLLQVWLEVRSRNLLFLCGILCGFAYGIKYTAALAMLLVLGVVAVSLQGLRSRLAAFATVGGAAALLAGPWILRNWLWLGNPFAPFFNRWFPNPYYHPGMEQIYRDGLSRYDAIPHWWQVPFELTIRGGGDVGGMLGPVFILAPLALLALRWQIGRLLLAAALFAGIPAYFNTGTRFLIPPLPFVAMALGIALQNLRGVMPALAVVHAVLSWPTILPFYCHIHAWRLTKPDIPAALRRIPENEYIVRHSAEVALVPLIEQVVAPGEPIFSFAGRPEAYLPRPMIVSYQSARGNLINDILLSPLQGYLPTEHRSWTFPPQVFNAVRVVQAASKDSFWTAAEMRVYRGDRELPRQASWRLRAHPNAWEVQLAFDNSPVTRWSSWEATRPGQFLEIHFGSAETVDAVVIESAPESDSKLEVQGLGTDGVWRRLAGAPVVNSMAAPRGARFAATREVKARGIRYLMLQDTDAFFRDAKDNGSYWGITRLSVAGGTYFYRID